MQDKANFQLSLRKGLWIESAKILWNIVENFGR